MSWNKPGGPPRGHVNAWGTRHRPPDAEITAQPGDVRSLYDGGSVYGHLPTLADYDREPPPEVYRARRRKYRSDRD